MIRKATERKMTQVAAGRKDIKTDSTAAHYIETTAISLYVTAYMSRKLSVSVHSFCSLSYDRSVASSKASFPLSASSFNFQYLFFSLRSSSSCLRLLPHRPVIAMLPYCRFLCLYVRQQLVSSSFLLPFESFKRGGYSEEQISLI
jgi:hypothetical protein